MPSLPVHRSSVSRRSVRSSAASTITRSGARSKSRKPRGADSEADLARLDEPSDIATADSAACSTNSRLVVIPCKALRRRRSGESFHQLIEERLRVIERLHLHALVTTVESNVLG